MPIQQAPPQAPMAPPFQQSTQSLQGPAQGQGGPSPTAALLAASQRPAHRISGGRGGRSAGGTNQGLAQGIAGAGSSIGNALRAKYQREHEEAVAKQQHEYALERQKQAQGFAREETDKVRQFGEVQKFADHLISASETRVTKLGKLEGAMGQALYDASQGRPWTTLGEGLEQFDAFLRGTPEEQQKLFENTGLAFDAEIDRGQDIWYDWMDSTHAKVGTGPEVDALREEMHEDRGAEQTMEVGRSLIEMRHLSPGQSAFGEMIAVTSAIGMTAFITSTVERNSNKAAQLADMNRHAEFQRQASGAIAAETREYDKLLGAYLKTTPAVKDPNTGIEITPEKTSTHYDKLESVWDALIDTDNETFADRTALSVRRPDAGANLTVGGIRQLLGLDSAPLDPEAEDEANLALASSMLGGVGSPTAKIARAMAEWKEGDDPLKIPPSLLGSFGAMLGEAISAVARRGKGKDKAALADASGALIKDVSDEEVALWNKRKGAVIGYLQTMKEFANSRGGLNNAITLRTAALTQAINNLAMENIDAGVPVPEALQLAARNIVEKLAPYLSLPGREAKMRAIKELAQAFGVEHHEEGEEDEPEKSEGVPQPPIPQPVQQPVQPAAQPAGPDPIPLGLSKAPNRSIRGGY